MKNNHIILGFLKRLSENNNKDWMDTNREDYLQAKNCWLKEVENVLGMLCKYDNKYYSRFEPKKCISRITNNRMYNQNLPIYKDYFTFSIMDSALMFSPIYISIGVGESFIGCGYHNPEKLLLKKIRDHIAYDGLELKKILENKKFKSQFGGLSDFIQPLKTSPKGYEKDHPFVEYLRYKSFTVSHKLLKKDILGNNFLDIIEQLYVLMEPFREYLKKIK